MPMRTLHTIYILCTKFVSGSHRWLERWTSTASVTTEIHSSPKVMAVCVRCQNLYDNLCGLIRFLVYLGSLKVFLVNFIDIGLTSIACETSKLGIVGIWEIKFPTKQVYGSNQYRDLFEEWNVIIRWSLLAQSIDYEHGDDGQNGDA